MNRKCLKRTVYLLLLFFVLPQAAGAMESVAVTVAELAAENEPGPYGGVSLQETTPFPPVVISPWELMEQVARQQSAQEAVEFFHGLGLPLDDADCEYIYHYKNQRAVERFPLETAALGFDEAVVVSYAYSVEENDNIVLLFTGQNGAYALTDCLYGFGSIRPVTDAARTTAWLIGDTGSAYQTTRWYSLSGRRIALSYLQKGTQSDRADVHVVVKSQGGPIENGTLPEDGLYAVWKQIGVIDFTKVESEALATETVLYTQISVYRAQADGSFSLLLSRSFEGLDLEEASRLPLRQLLEKDSGKP